MSKSPRILMAALLALASAAPARAAHNEAAAESAALALVRTATSGQIDAAFAGIREYGLVREPGIDARLDALKAQLGSDTPALGGPAARIIPQSPQPQVFPGCLVREYTARYARGSQRWWIKFRRTGDGWKLSDLMVRTEHG